MCGFVADRARVEPDRQLQGERKDEAGSTACGFDVKAFPVNRGLRRDPRVIMEWALMADGVPPGEVYATLETHEYKLPAALFEDVHQISPEWRPHVLAASAKWLHGSQSNDNPAVAEAREALM